MKILLINTLYYPNMEGGAEQSTKLLAENMVKQGNEVAVYCIDSKKDKIEIENINGVIVYRGNGGGYLNRINNKNIFNKLFMKYKDIYNVEASREVLWILEDFKPNVVHTNCLNGISINVWKYIKNKEIPIVHTLRDYALISPRGILEIKPERKGIYPLYLYWHQYISRKYSNLVDGVTAPSEFTVNKFIENGYFTKAKVKKCVVNSIEYSDTRLKNNIKEQEKRITKRLNFYLLVDY